MVAQGRECDKRRANPSPRRQGRLGRCRFCPAEVVGLLGGGKRDGGWDSSGQPKSGLAILPGLTHYTIFSAPALAATVIPFLDEPTPKVQ